ncbi:hypothetical protein [Streptomyces mirabilis]|uniref:hypothetical protein n=2 Tax=Streptomyces mirabilis TaxID=68239 RepID=UPI0036CCA25E
MGRSLTGTSIAASARVELRRHGVLEPQFTDVIDSAKDGHSIRAVTYDATTGKRRNTCETSSVKDCEISPRIAKGHEVRVKVYWVKGKTATYLGTVTTDKGKLPVV